MLQQVEEFLLKINQIVLFAKCLYIIIPGDDLDLWEMVPDNFKIMIIRPKNIKWMKGFDADCFLTHEKSYL